VLSCRRELRETWKSGERQSQLEVAYQTLEVKVSEGTEELLKKTEKALANYLR